jgi:hopanoid biosynthesis associated RND transporter like protein HpnN
MELQHVILVQPKLDPGTLQPGGRATRVIREAVATLGYNQPGMPRVRLTGQVPLADEEFASAADGALFASVGSLVLVIIWLLLALRSVRLIAAIVITLVTGFALTAGFAAIAVGTLNLISIAFAVLFIGLAVDFSIQYSVRYRDERYREPELGKALQATAGSIGTPIAVAALATAAGFYSFLPTAFQGVSELGKIAGTGMLIAFACNMTVLPALLTLFRPKAEQEPVGYRFTAPVDAFLKRRRWLVIALGCLIALIGAIMLPQLHFDFDPLHVKNQKSESVATLNDLMDNPLTTPYSAEILEPDLQAAVARAAELEKLPDVLHALTLASFIPEDQDKKRALVDDAANFLLPTLEPPQVAPTPTPAQVRQSIVQCRIALEAALAKSGADPAVSAFVATLKTMESADDAKIAQLTPVLVGSLPDRLQDLKDLLEAPPVTVETLPEDIRSDWIGVDGKARIEVYPKGDARQNAVLKGFFNTIERVAPDATGSAITIQQSAETIVGAFKTAGLSALGVIAIILAVVLRNAIDVALVLGPLLLAALMTVIVCVAWPYPLNFANIIALPLLLGIGVAFDIYFVMNWRKGQTLPLQSPTARAVLFSALTTGTAFGSLALSHHPGTASMGVLLIISLIATLLCTLIVLPSLLAGLHGDKNE